MKGLGKDPHTGWGSTHLGPDNLTKTRHKGLFVLALRAGRQ